MSRHFRTRELKFDWATWGTTHHRSWAPFKGTTMRFSEAFVSAMQHLDLSQIREGRWKVERWMNGDPFTLWPENVRRLKAVCLQLGWPTDGSVFDLPR